MNRPGIEPLSPGLLANQLPTMSRYTNTHIANIMIYLSIYIYLCIYIYIYIVTWYATERGKASSIPVSESPGTKTDR